MDAPILKVENLTKYFEIGGGGFFGTKAHVHAVENVSFALYPSETLGIVGESGSGKSTLARVILGLLGATGGKVFYEGQDITGLKGPSAKRLHQDLQMVFQDPYASLNPRMKVGDAILEPLLSSKLAPNKVEGKKNVEKLLDMVGLQSSMYDRFPHEFSGGQRQRIGIARALVLSPKVLICDESVSALDVSVQAQILNLFNHLKERLNLTYMFIGHDLSVVKYISDRIMVLYLGEVMELATTEDLFAYSLHPYTQALISAIPEPSTKGKKDRIILEGDIPSAVNPPSGCRFNTRCFRAQPICSLEHPALQEVRPGHFVACHFWQKGGEVNG